MQSLNNLTILVSGFLPYVRQMVQRVRGHLQHMRFLIPTPAYEIRLAMFNTPAIFDEPPDYCVFAFIYSLIKTRMQSVTYTPIN